MKNVYNILVGIGSPEKKKPLRIPLLDSEANVVS
jgi:hypothetical protein